MMLRSTFWLWLWHAAPVLRRSAPWAAAVLMLLLAAVLAGGLAPHWQQQARVAGQQADRLTRQAQRQRLAAALVPPASWRDSLPAVSARNDRLAGLLRLPDSLDLAMPLATQGWTEDATAGIARLQLTLIARGRYTDLRRLLEAALAQDPALVLEHIAFTRPAGDVAWLDAELRFVLLERSSGPADDGAARLAARQPAAAAGAQP
jgi:hypothetical protein